jgi:chromate transporter
MQDDEFGEILALANALPGPIATKMAAYLGYRLKGVSGAVVAVLAHILPTSVAMVALLGFLYALRHSKVVAGMIAAVRPVIVVMLGLMAYEFAVKAGKGLGKGPALFFGVLALLLLAAMDVHPALVVLLALVYGSMHLRVAARIQERRNRSGPGRGGPESGSGGGTGTGGREEGPGA